MAYSMEIDLDDLNRIQKILKTLPVVAQYKIVNKGMKRAMKPVQLRIKQALRRFDKTNAERRSRGKRPGAMANQVRIRSQRPKRRNGAQTQKYGKSLANVRVGVITPKTGVAYKVLARSKSTYHKRPAFYVKFFENEGFTDKGGVFHAPTHTMLREMQRSQSSVFSEYTRYLGLETDSATAKMITQTEFETQLYSMLELGLPTHAGNIYNHHAEPRKRGEHIVYEFDSGFDEFDLDGDDDFAQLTYSFYGYTRQNRLAALAMSDEIHALFRNFTGQLVVAGSINLDGVVRIDHSDFSQYTGDIGTWCIRQTYQFTYSEELSP